MDGIFECEFPSFDLENGFLLDIIRPESDSAEYFFYMNNPHVREFISAGNLPVSIEKAREDLQYWSGLFNARRGFYWAIRDQINHNLIGTIGFNSLSFVHFKGEISYDLAFAFWGKGIMTKAINKIVDFAHAKLKLVRVQAYSAKSNKKSLKLLERCKFKAEGVLHKFELLHGRHLDYVMYASVK
jgi:ribosomal-protein-alanine N-acetyltransferase